MTEFVLNERLEADCHTVVDWPLCRLLLMDDQRFPWLILVPRRADITECYQLAEHDQQQLWDESMRLGRWMMTQYQGHKLNVAALGNVVSQLHLHHVVRYTHDACWPAPIWGQGSVEVYSPEALETQLTRVRSWAREAF